MKHFKKPDGSVWAYELDGSQDFLITPDMVPCEKPTPPVPSWAQIKAAELAAIHDTFEATINRLMGIAARLTRSGDTPSALTCDSAVRALIALPNTAAVLAAGDPVALKLAVKSEYAKAAALLSLVAKTEFRSMG